MLKTAPRPWPRPKWHSATLSSSAARSTASARRSWGARGLHRAPRRVRRARGRLLKAAPDGAFQLVVPAAAGAPHRTYRLSAGSADEMQVDGRAQGRRRPAAAAAAAVDALGRMTALSGTVTASGGSSFAVRIQKHLATQHASDDDLQASSAGAPACCPRCARCRPRTSTCTGRARARSSTSAAASSPPRSVSSCAAASSRRRPPRSTAGRARARQGGARAAQARRRRQPAAAAGAAAVTRRTPSMWSSRRRRGASGRPRRRPRAAPLRGVRDEPPEAFGALCGRRSSPLLATRQADGRHPMRGAAQRARGRRGAAAEVKTVDIRVCEKVAVGQVGWWVAHSVVRVLCIVCVRALAPRARVSPHMHVGRPAPPPRGAH